MTVLAVFVWGAVLLIAVSLYYLFGVIAAVVLILLALLSSIKVIDQWERGLVLTLGRYTTTLGPGLRFVLPIVQRLIKIDLRINTIDIPSQEVITKDNVPVKVNAVVYFKVERPEDAMMKIQDYAFAVSQYAQTALRDAA